MPEKKELFEGIEIPEDEIVTPETVEELSNGRGDDE